MRSLKHPIIGISIKENIGLGDKIQYSSVPENYFKSTGRKLVDVSKPWFFDYNPYVLRGVKPDKIVELWNFPTVDPWKNPRKFPTDPPVYLCNAEVPAARLGVKTYLNRPRLYRFEDFPFETREKILLHTHGKSHGAMPDHVIDHVIQKYGKLGTLFHIGLPSDPDIGIPKISTPTLWDLARVLSEARVFIGVDSGPSWVAACFPDVISKKVKLRYVAGQKELCDWVPLEIKNVHAHWDDRAFQICNPTGDDVGFTSSYLRI